MNIVGLLATLTTDPLRDPALPHPVAEVKGEYTIKGKEPPKGCLCHFAYLIFCTIS